MHERIDGRVNAGAFFGSGIDAIRRMHAATGGEASPGSPGRGPQPGIPGFRLALE
jgi:hypothetical protein